MATPLRVGVIGCGRAGLTRHLPALARISGIEAVAAADPSPAALEAVRRAFGIARRTSDYHELLSDASLDAVCVAVPVPLHAEIASSVLAAGKHLLVEKPLALSLDECDALVEQASEAGRTAMVGFNLRWHRHVRRAREAIRTGRLGDVLLVRSVFTNPSSFRLAEPGWRRDPARGGGMLALQGVHHIDLWRFLVEDEVEEVFALTDPGEGGPEAAVLAASTSTGIRLGAELCAGTSADNEVAVYGSEGRLRASLYRFDGLEMASRSQAGGELRHRLGGLARFARELVGSASRMRGGGEFVASYEAEWRHFLDAVAHGTPVDCTLEEGREAVRVLLAALESAALGRPVRVEDAPRLSPESVGQVGLPANASRT
jgi:myo-inositol 2-dehydrogenase/D-chiro-inositol 1-dehydrogenase